MKLYPYIYEFMLNIVDMSKTGILIILGVILIRFYLRKVPKKYSYFLWLIVAIRLLCPFSIESVFSVFNVEKVITPIFENETIISEVLTYTQPLYYENRIQDIELSYLSGSGAYPIKGSLTNYFNYWFIGVLIILNYTISSYFLVHGSIKQAIKLKDNVYQSEKIKSPFVLGFFKPKIYIPYHLDEQTQKIILEHENYHILRKDHLFRYLALMICVIYWFNPFVWLAYQLFIQDMEMSCDEYVLMKHKEENKTYSYTLLSFASDQQFSMPKPVAFGEKSIKKRIKNILNWKIPNKKTRVLALLSCALTLVAFASNPTKQDTLTNLLEKYSIYSIDTMNYQIHRNNYKTELDDWLHIHRFNHWFDLIQVSKYEIEPTNETIKTTYMFTDDNNEVTFHFTENYDTCIVETKKYSNTYRIINHDVAESVLEEYYNWLNLYAYWYPNGFNQEGSTIDFAYLSLSEDVESDDFSFDEYAHLNVGDSSGHFYGKCDYLLEEDQLTLISREDSNVFVFDMKKDRYEVYITFNEEKSKVDSKELIEVLNQLTFTMDPHRWQYDY